MTNNLNRPMRSDMVKKGFERAPHRSLLRATGVIQSDDDFNKPFIAIANSYIDIIPGHAHLNVFGEVVREAVRAAGGVPFMFNTIGVDDGIAMGHAGMKYSLPSRELIADSVETMIAAHCFDGMICIPNCDKIVPGMLMAAMRLNIPTIFISGGPMKAGVTPSGKVVDLISVFEGVGAYRAGKIDDAGLRELEQFGCPTCGSCSGMFTANSMNCLCEALGMALPGNGTILAVDPRREELARAAARQLLNADRPRSQAAGHRHRAMRSTTRLRWTWRWAARPTPCCTPWRWRTRPASTYPLARLNEVAERVPNICKVSPSSSYHIEDVDRAGGVSAILWELSKRPGILHTDTITVTGKTLLENVQGAESLDKACIRPLENPYSERGGLAILFGNLAPDGAVIKTAGVLPEMLCHRGPAVVFDSHDEANAGILSGKVKAGDVVVIRYEGPKGGPGMQEMLAPTSNIMGMGLGRRSRCLPTAASAAARAARASATSRPRPRPVGRSVCSGMATWSRWTSPRGGWMWMCPDDELARRRAEWRAPQRTLTGWLKRYTAMVTSGSQGAVLAV